MDAARLWKAPFSFFFLLFFRSAQDLGSLPIPSYAPPRTCFEATQVCYRHMRLLICQYRPTYLTLLFLHSRFHHYSFALHKRIFCVQNVR